MLINEESCEAINSDRIKKIEKLEDLNTQSLLNTKKLIKELESFTYKEIKENKRTFDELYETANKSVKITKDLDALLSHFKHKGMVVPMSFRQKDIRHEELMGLVNNDK